MDDNKWSAIWAIAIFATAFESAWTRAIAALLSCAMLVYFTYKNEWNEI